ncbi:MAG: hypothetical protein SGBAC_010603 [Bacillariaceae sp.]
MMEKGLYRNGLQIAQGKKHSVFPSLHNVTSGSVGRKLTTVIRENLPHGTPLEIQKQFSGKSTRIGSISTMCRHRSMGVLQVCTRSGHATGLNVDAYRDRSDLVAGLPAALALHGSNDLEAPVVPFRLSALGEDVSGNISQLIQEMFPCNISHFHEMGRLWPVTRIVAASMIAFYNDVNTELGYNNALSWRLREAAVKVKLQDPLLPNQRPEAVLAKWSTRIMDDFQHRSEHAPSTRPEMASLAETTNSIHRTVLSLAAIVQDLSQKHDDLWTVSVEQKAQIAVLQHSNEMLEAARQKDREHHARLRQCLQSPSAPSPKRPRFAQDTSNIATSTYGTGNATAIALLDEFNCSNPLPIGSTPTKMPPVVHHDDSMPTERSGTKKGNEPRLMDCLLLLKREHRLNDIEWKKSNLAGKIVKEKSLLKYSLELCDFVFKTDQILKPTFIGAADFSGNERAAFAIETACWSKAIELLGMNVREEEKRTKNGRKKTYRSIGTMVLQFKQHVKDEVKKYAAVDNKDVPLMERKQVQELSMERGASQTPEGHKSLFVLFSKARSK